MFLWDGLQTHISSNSISVVGKFTHNLICSCGQSWIEESNTMIHWKLGSLLPYSCSCHPVHCVHSATQHGELQLLLPQILNLHNQKTSQSLVSRVLVTRILQLFLLLSLTTVAILLTLLHSVLRYLLSSVRLSLSLLTNYSALLSLI